MGQVLIAMGATIPALFELRRHGGEPWQPPCCAPIGGTAVASFMTSLLGLVTIASPY